MSNIDLQEGVASRIEGQHLVRLIADIAEGKEQALGLLYEQTSSQIYGLAYRILNDATIAEEVTLDVYMQVWRQAKQFDQTRGKPIVWLTVLTRSRAIDRLRSGQKERESQQSLETISEQEDMKESPEEASAFNQQCRIVQQALALLSVEQRTVIEMAYFSGLTQSEIAARIGEPLGTVKTRIRLGMIKLRNILSPLNEGLLS